MNILLVTPFALSVTGGVSTTLRMLRREFTDMRHAVTILTDADHDRIHHLQQEGEEVYGLYLRPPFIEGLPVRAFVAFCAYLPLTLAQLHRFLAERRIDIVNIQYPTHSSVYFLLLRPFAKWRLVATFLGNDVHDIPVFHWTARWITRWLLSRADEIVTVSNSLFVKLTEMFPNLRCHHSVIPTATPTDIPQAGGSDLPVLPERFVMTAGHLIARKGVDVLLRAIVLLARKGESINLVVAGEGPLRGELESYCRSNGIHGNVVFLGDTPHSQVLTLLARADVFVLCSRAEGLPVVILEAMASGTPVVATAVDGVPEVLEHERTGLLVGPEDSEGIAAAILRLMTQESLRQSLSVAGRERVTSEYSWSSVAQRYIKAFENLSGGSASPSRPVGRQD